jgi:hypothetical protein
MCDSIYYSNTNIIRGDGKMENKPCQSCNMPMSNPEDFGKEADGSPSTDYCVHCYQNGDFTWKPTFEEFVEGNYKFWREEGESENAEDDAKARARVMAVLPTLKRWAKA